jgi:hypothetical protein
VADATFQEVFDWLADRKGERVVIEVGRRDPRAQQLADFPVPRLHTTLGAIRRVEDRKHGTGVVRVPIGDNELSGIEVDPARFQLGQIHGGALKVWQHDIYIAVAGGRD